MLGPTERFSSRVENYLKYRPHYPQEIVHVLEEECGLATDWRIADIGSGTGFSAEPFLKNGNTVFGIEPNGPMRRAAEAFLQEYPNFTSVEGIAEDTTLADASVDMVIAGQAFHWFDHPRARAEFKRILRPGGWVVLFWNDRKHTDEFQNAYDRLLGSHAPEYDQVKHENLYESEMRRFFEPGTYKLRMCENSQVLDFEGLKGRVLSSSYAPEPDQPHYEPMIADIRSMFDAHQQDGHVTVEYALRLYIGQVPSP